MDFNTHQAIKCNALPLHQDTQAGGDLRDLNRRPDNRILLVEDDAINQEVAVRLLFRLGYRADTVRNGLEALAALQECTYKLVLMDCEMPEMDGYEASRRIRERESSAGRAPVPIIALTAHAMAGDRSKCLDAGMNDHLSKPISMALLGEMVDKWLNGRDAEVKTPTSATTSLTFDEGDLLRRLMGDRELACIIIAEFLQTALPQFQSLTERLGVGDVSEARRQAHSLKGAAATISASALREVAAGIEDAANAGDATGAAKLLVSAKYELERLAEVLKGFRRSG